MKIATGDGEAFGFLTTGRGSTPNGAMASKLHSSGLNEDKDCSKNIQKGYILLSGNLDNR